jgi:hypothetical protein
MADAKKKYGMDFEDQYKESRAWVIDSTKGALAANANHINSTMNSVVGFEDHFLESPYFLNRFLFSDENTHTIGILYHREEWILQVYNYQSH